jgi:phosphoribosylformylglycinamidine cyclo-ligase
MSHVTGGGLAANLARVLPRGVVADIDRSTWTPAPIFDLVRRVGSVALPDLEKTLNCGVGMIAAVHPDDATAAVDLLTAAGVPAWVAGVVAGGVDPEAEPVALLHGAYQGW